MLVLGWCLLGDGGGDLAVELLEAPHPGVGGHVLHPPAVQYSTVQYSTVLHPPHRPRHGVHHLLPRTQRRPELDRLLLDARVVQNLAIKASNKVTRKFA